MESDGPYVTYPRIEASRGYDDNDIAITLQWGNFVLRDVSVDIRQEEARALFLVKLSTCVVEGDASVLGLRRTKIDSESD